MPLRSSARSPHQIAATGGSKDSPPAGNFSGVQIALRNVLGGIFAELCYSPNFTAHFTLLVLITNEEYNELTLTSYHHGKRRKHSCQCAPAGFRTTPKSARILEGCPRVDTNHCHRTHHLPADPILCCRTIRRQRRLDGPYIFNRAIPDC